LKEYSTSGWSAASNRNSDAISAEIDWPSAVSSTATLPRTRRRTASPNVLPITAAAAARASPALPGDRCAPPARRTATSAEALSLTPRPTA
jgi:hypothetical protein